MGSVLTDCLYRRRQGLTALAYVVVIGELVVWLTAVRRLLLNFGLFVAVGYDFGMYLSQVWSLRSTGPSTMYHLNFLNHYHQLLAVYSADPHIALPTAPVPYPPIFAWLLSPLALLSPPLSFALWTALSILALAHLNAQIGECGPAQRPTLRFLVLLLFPGIMASLVLGQVMIFLACAMAECYLCLSSGRDLRAGLWLATFGLKPHYAVLLGLLLVWKRRWWAVCGAMLGSCAVAVSSVIVTGPSTLREYAASVLLDAASFRGGMNINPRDMVNWRGLVLTILPSITDRAGNASVLVLTALTLVAAIYICRGPWLPTSRRFPIQIAAVLVATLLINYHSPVYGLVLLAAPIAAHLSQIEDWTPARVTLLSGFIFVSLVQPLGFLIPYLKYAPTILLTLTLAVSLIYFGWVLNREITDVTIVNEPEAGVPTDVPLEFKTAG